MKGRITTATAIGTLIGMLLYSFTFMWTASHAQYARADDVDYLLEKAIAVDIWRYEDEIEKMVDISLELQETELGSRALVRVNTRIIKLRKRLLRLESKLDSIE